jgi:hypothetical protein
MSFAELFTGIPCNVGKYYAICGNTTGGIFYAEALAVQPLLVAAEKAIK